VRIEKSSYSSYNFSKELIEASELSRVKFDKCNFRFTDFSEIDVMYGCAFESCDFTNARLNGVTIKDCAFLSCKFNNASFFATTLEDCKMTGSDFLNAECGLAQIIGGDWSYTVLRKQSFHKVDLSNVRFFGADLTECHFNECKMSGCEFNQADAHETTFYKSDMRHSSLESFNILEASFRQTKLDLEQCVLIAEYVTEGRYTPDQVKK
jgi:uncharacterized protein YjbI with pentapeptide repeats